MKKQTTLVKTKDLCYDVSGVSLTRIAKITFNLLRFDLKKQAAIIMMVNPLCEITDVHIVIHETA